MFHLPDAQSRGTLSVDASVPVKASARIDTPVLVFLPSRSLGQKLAALLVRAGIPAVSCTTPVGFEGAVRSGDYALTVTVTHLIAVARSASRLPIVNLDVFISQPSGDELGSSDSVCFDSQRFLHRVRDTSEKDQTHLRLATAFV